MKRILRSNALVRMAKVADLTPDETNPRKSDNARMGLLALSISKLGFIMPVFVERTSRLLLSGHQRLTVAKQLGVESIPVIEIDVKAQDIKGINILFNRATNDMNAFDTGKKAQGKLDIGHFIDAADELPDADHSKPYALNVVETDMRPLAYAMPDRYDKKAVTLAGSMIRMGIKIPVVVTRSGVVVNGVNRVFAALESGLTQWPTIQILDIHATVAMNFLNYLSMDFHVDDEFKSLIRYSAYRRPANSRGALPKAYRFWANGHQTLLDKVSYSTEYWREFRNRHGKTVLDFGAGLGRVAPYLRTKGFVALDFEPYRIDPASDVGTPSPSYSKKMARVFLDEIADPNLSIDSIFLASVLNSVPFPHDRLCVLAICHALSGRSTRIYGTCRDISDFNYEYGGIRNANYFTFDSEPGVRVGDIMRNPKLQKFETQDSARAMFDRFWKSIKFWPGGNVFYFELGEPKGINTKALASALELEFNLPYADESTMGLVDHAKACFSKRLGVSL